MRRTKFVQRSAQDVTEPQAFERSKWPQVSGGGVAREASPEGLVSAEETVTRDGTRSPFAEVDHSSSLRAR